ncbi:MAG TPA: PIN/TRAM domain-containing protein [Phycisphaerales bacterium]|nr:PIN/TRAM domain-containing protein [Phycisphaerales bacterium]
MSDQPDQTKLHPREIAERQRAKLLTLVRATFVIVFVTVAALALLSTTAGEPGAVQFGGLALKGSWQVVLIMALIFGGLTLATDLLTPTKKISTLTSIFFGLLVAMLGTFAIGLIIDLLVQLYEIKGPVILTTKVFIGIGMSYICIATVLQTQDDFRLVIPYVEFAKQIRGVRPLIIDSSALIDARIAGIAETGVFQAPLIIPRFIVDELQMLSDSKDTVRRAKGRRGLDVITQLQRNPGLDVTIDESEVPAKAVDQMLLELAKRTQAVMVTLDSGLSRVASINGVPVLDINALAEASKPITASGELVTLKLIRPGEHPGQAVGYLADGTMVVVSQADALIEQTVDVEVESTIQTSAGRMVFAKLSAEYAEQSTQPNLTTAREEPEQDPSPAPEIAEPEQTDQDSAGEDINRERPVQQRPAGPFPPERPVIKEKSARRRNPRR